MHAALNTIFTRLLLRGIKSRMVHRLFPLGITWQ